jgi:Zn-dependent protease
LGFDNPEFWLRAIMSLVVFILSLTIHEYAHARVAFALGDDTAARQGRMTLNPIVHIDPIGTILMPILGARGLPVIGWAKPVPVSPVGFSRKISMRGGMALVAVAGPMSNFLLAFLCVLALWFIFFSGVVPALPANIASPTAHFFYIMSIANIGLGIFNLLPIPPLDGSRLMPRSLDALMETLSRYTYIVFILIILFGRGLISVPVRFVVGLLYSIFNIDLRMLQGLMATLG